MLSSTPVCEPLTSAECQQCKGCGLVLCAFVCRLGVADEAPNRQTVQETREGEKERREKGPPLVA